MTTNAPFKYDKHKKLELPKKASASPLGKQQFTQIMFWGTLMGALKKVILRLFDYYWKFYDLFFEDDDYYYNDNDENYWWDDEDY